MIQIVVYTDEYGTTVYHEEGVEVLEFDFKRYDDEIPDDWALAVIKRDIDKIDKEKLPEAFETLDKWYKENKRWSDEILESEERYRREEKEKELETDRKVLEKYGLDTSIVG